MTQDVIVVAGLGSSLHWRCTRESGCVAWLMML